MLTSLYRLPSILLAFLVGCAALLAVWMEQYLARIGGIMYFTPGTRRDLEIVSHLRAQALTASAGTQFGRDFPLGEGWYGLMLRFNFAVVIGTGAGPVTEGELLIIKNVRLQTSAGEVICNLPGRALYKIAAALQGTPPRKDAVAAANGTYRVDLPIMFVDDRMKRPEDTILDTGRYGSLSLEVTMGAIGDLFGTVGTATVAQTLDIEIERTKGRLPQQGGPTNRGALPVAHRYYGAAPSQDANSQTFIDLDRAPDLAYKRLFAHECATGTAGGVFTGANADDVKDLESVTDQSGDIVRQRIHEMIQNQNKRDFSLESVLAGVTIFDFVRDGSINSALYPGDRSRLKFEWTNKAGVAANDIVSVAFDAIRGLRG